MAKQARQIQTRDHQSGELKIIAPPAIREAEADHISTGKQSPIQFLQHSLLERLETGGLMTRWPSVVRLGFVLVAIAACWLAILLPMAF